MAKVKNPLMSEEASGTVRGITFARVRGGWVAKGRPRPPTDNAGFRPRIRSILGYLSRQWGGLTDGQRSAWEAFAEDHPGVDSFGDSFIMSGINYYVKLNHPVIRLQGGGMENALPPEDPPVSAVDSLSAVIGAANPGEIDLTWTELGVGAAGDFWEIQVAGPFQSKGRVQVTSRFAYVAITVGGVLLFTLTGLDEGFWYWIRVRYMSGEGQKTAWVYAQQTPKVTP